MKTLAGALIIFAAGIAGCAASDARIAKTQKRADQTIAALELMTDADSLAAAGIMSTGNSDRSLSLLGRAVTAAPYRPDLLWLQAMRCAQLPPCNPAPAERRLRELDPANGAAWWAEMTRAGSAHDAEGVDIGLAAISHSDRVDIYWTALIAHLSRVVANTKKMSLAESEVTVIGYLAAEAIPPYQTISTSCKGGRLQQPGVIDICRGVAKALLRGDTYITEMVGVAVAKRVWPEDSPEWKAAAEQRRVYDYRSKLYSKIELRTLTHPEEYLTLCAQNRREADLFAAQLTAAGFDPDPPAQPTSKAP
jgi:hypothetical protein